MAEYKEILHKNGLLYTKKIIEKPSTKTLDAKKGLQRKAIEEQIFDLNDSVADNAKMISMVFTVVTRIWEAMPQEQKDTIDPADVTVIDETIRRFKDTTTWADRLFAEEGFDLVDRLFERQGKIGEILDK